MCAERESVAQLLCVTIDLPLWYTPPIMGKTNQIELDEANEIIIREALRRLLHAA